MGTRKYVVQCEHSDGPKDRRKLVNFSFIAPFLLKMPWFEFSPVGETSV